MANDPIIPLYLHRERDLDDCLRFFLGDLESLLSLLLRELSDDFDRDLDDREDEGSGDEGDESRRLLLFFFLSLSDDDDEDDEEELLDEESLSEDESELESLSLSEPSFFTRRRSFSFSSNKRSATPRVSKMGGGGGAGFPNCLVLDALET